MKTNEEKAGLFKAAILQYQLLIRNGYVLTGESWKLYGTELHGPDEEPHYCIELSSPSERRISIYLHFNEIGYLGFFLENTLKKESFMLTDWMLYHSELRDRQNMFRLSSYPEDFESAVPAFLENLDKLFEYPDLRNMLEGNSWEEIHFDWGDLK